METAPRSSCRDRFAAILTSAKGLAICCRQSWISTRAKGSYLRKPREHGEALYAHFPNMRAAMSCWCHCASEQGGRAVPFQACVCILPVGARKISVAFWRLGLACRPSSVVWWVAFVNPGESVPERGPSSQFYNKSKHRTNRSCQPSSALNPVMMRPGGLPSSNAGIGRYSRPVEGGLPKRCRPQFLRLAGRRRLRPGAAVLKRVSNRATSAGCSTAANPLPKGLRPGVTAAARCCGRLPGLRRRAWRSPAGTALGGDDAGQ